MLTLEEVVSRWKPYVEAAPVHKHPTVWVGHFGTTTDALIGHITGRTAPKLELLGALSATEPFSVGNAVLLLAQPYAECYEITECAVVVDVSRTLHITQMADLGGTWTTRDWRLRWGLADDGKARFGLAKQEPSDYWSECNIIHVQRSRGSQDLDFHSAYMAALHLGEQVL